MLKFIIHAWFPCFSSRADYSHETVMARNCAGSTSSRDATQVGYSICTVIYMNVMAYFIIHVLNMNMMINSMLLDYFLFFLRLPVCFCTKHQ